MRTWFGGQDLPPAAVPVDRPTADRPVLRHAVAVPYATVFQAEPFTVSTAESVGLTRGWVRSLVRSGQLCRILRGVYVDRQVPDSLELRARALAFVVPADAVVCLRTAAWLWGVDALAFGAHLSLPPLDFMRPAGRSAIRRQEALGRTGPVVGSDVVDTFGQRVTTPVRTTADLLRLLPRPDALAASDAMARNARVVAADVEDLLVTRFVGYRGVVQARELVLLVDGRSESMMESRTRLRAIDAGFPPFEPQVNLFDEKGGFLARLDLGRREERRGLEFDGDKAHASRAQQRHDLLRRRRVEAQGWALMVVTSEHVLGRGLAFEYGVAELLGREMRLTRNHPRYGGWDPPYQSLAG